MQVISGGNEGFNAMLYGEQSIDNRAFFQSQIERLPSLGIIADVGQRFAEMARETYERFNGSRAMHLARAATRQITALFQPEAVRSLFDIADFQTASLTMQRWIMANPVIRQAYHDQLCDGYSDTYVDMDPGKVGEAHYDYRRVMDSVVQFDAKDNFVVKQYLDPLRKGDQELRPSQKVDILSTWHIAELFHAKQEKDLTSQYDGYL